MASILRQIVASPRARHPEARLDLCYVTDNIVVTSGPSSVWPKKAYRNPLDQVVAFLDKKHGDQWSIFEFRAEGTGYPDSEVYNRIHHFPWPDHHPPPFAIVPNLMAAMRNWLQPEQDAVGASENKRVAVIHCKAGKGRSGTATCSYLISQEGWRRDDALHRFTLRRMRAGFGNGVSIPSQLRWVRYVDRWTNEMSKKYVERPVEVVEVHIQGLRDGVKVAVEGFVDGGRRIQNVHTFTRAEKTLVDLLEVEQPKSGTQNHEILISPTEGRPAPWDPKIDVKPEADSQDVILKPAQPIQLKTSDLNIDFERRNQVKYTGYTYVTSVAHVWFNAWFEGGFIGEESGVFEIDWEAMDGIKGSARKGIKAFDKMKVVWKYIDQTTAQPVNEPQKGEPVPEGEPANWQGDNPVEESEARHSDGLDSGRSGGALLTMGAMINQGADTLSKELGLRKADPASAELSRANSIKDPGSPTTAHAQVSEELRRVEQEEQDGIKSHHPNDVDDVEHKPVTDQEGIDGRADTAVGRNYEAAMKKASDLVSKVKGEGGHGGEESSMNHSRESRS